MATRLQTTVQQALGNIAGWMHARPTQSAPHDRRPTAQQSSAADDLRSFL